MKFDKVQAQELATLRQELTESNHRRASLTQTLANANQAIADLRAERNDARRTAAMEHAVAEKALAEVAQLRAVAEVVLLFHHGGCWSDENNIRWIELTGSEWATTVVLCNIARKALGR